MVEQATAQKIEAVGATKVRSQFNLSCKLAKAVLFVPPLSNSNPQLTIMVPSDLLRRLYSHSAGKNLDNQQLVQLLFKLAPEIAAEIRSVVDKSMVYPYSQISGDYKRVLSQAACNVKRLFSGKDTGLAVGLRLEVADLELSESMHAAAGESATCKKLLADLSDAEARYRLRKSVNNELPEVSFVELAEKIKLAFKLYAEGMKLRPIAETISVNYGAVKNWLAGKLVFYGISHVAAETIRHTGLKSVDFSKLTEEESGFLLGSYLASHGGRKRIVSHVSLTSHGKAACRLAEIFSKILPEGSAEPKLKVKGQTWTCIVRSRNLLELLEQLTDGGTAVPYEKLKSAGSRAAFLKGFFGFRHQIKGSAILLSKPGKPALIVHIACMLDELGLTPRVAGKTNSNLIIADKLGLSRALELGLITEESEINSISTYLRSQADQQAYTAQQYSAAMNYGLGKSKKEVTLEKMSRDLNIPEVTLHSWRNGGVKPTCVKRREQLQMLRRIWQVPSLEIYFEVQKNFQLHPKEAQKIAAQMTQAEFSERLELIQKVGMNLRRVSEAFEVPYVVLEQACLYYAREIKKMPGIPVSIIPAHTTEERQRRSEFIINWAQKHGIKEDTLSFCLEKIVQRFAELGR